MLDSLTEMQRETYERGLWCWWSYDGARAVQYVEQLAAEHARVLRAAYSAQEEARQSF